jgi:hypothetical protein
MKTGFSSAGQARGRGQERALGLTHLLAAPRSAIEPVRRYFPGD